MSRVRARLASRIERCVLGSGLLRADHSRYWTNCRRLIFVCKGNVCRSPYAAAAARRRGMRAISCGVSTTAGMPADSTAIEQAAHRGLDLSSHVTARWQDIAVADHDVVVAMQLRHALAVLPRATAHSCPVVVFSALLLPAFAMVEDPYGCPASRFQAVFDLIDTGIERLVRMNELPVVLP